MHFGYIAKVGEMLLLPSSRILSIQFLTTEEYFKCETICLVTLRTLQKNPVPSTDCLPFLDMHQNCDFSSEMQRTLEEITNSIYFLNSTM